MNYNYYIVQMGNEIEVALDHRPGWTTLQVVSGADLLDAWNKWQTNPAKKLRRKGDVEE